jgi:arsenate reductase-like glutaredoxin family protein
LVKEIKELTKTKEYNFEKILKNSEERLKEINIEIETIRNKEEIKKIKKILEMEGIDREKALSEALAA